MKLSMKARACYIIYTIKLFLVLDYLQNAHSHSKMFFEYVK